MRRTRFADWPCPIARTTDLMGDWWMPLIMREAFMGRKRFDEFRRSLKIPTAVLSTRLERLVEEGLLVRVAYEDHPPRYDYRLTDKGHAFYDVLAAMWRWGADWMWEDDDMPIKLVDRDSGEEIVPAVIDANTGNPIDVRKLAIHSK